MQKYAVALEDVEGWIKGGLSFLEFFLAFFPARDPVHRNKNRVQGSRGHLEHTQQCAVESSSTRRSLVIAAGDWRSLSMPVVQRTTLPISVRQRRPVTSGGHRWPPVAASNFAS
ncbi:hypothetical protein B0H13DRAFT_1876359 [Mycena leptocephala]|nr:hypothetical protein B0H13DRAFT_1876359 [Mycena leptocephala]